MRIFIFLLMLTLSISQAAEQDNSTQMYYAKLTIDRSALERISENLNFLVSDKKVNIEDVGMTTECTKPENNTFQKWCECKEGHRWSDEACLKQSCCGQDGCFLPETSVHKCILNSTVDITGEITVKADGYIHCLTSKTSTAYINCHNSLSKLIKGFYSTIRGFDTLEIKDYRAGSVVVDFEMTIVSSNITQRLLEKSMSLGNNLSASVTLETIGIVNMIVPSQPVKYNYSTKIECKTLENLDARAKWNLKRDNKEFLITNGTTSNVREDAKSSYVSLNRAYELWEGEYICLFEQQKNNTVVKNKANAALDICLLPKIDISAEPTFPRCKEEQSAVIVDVECRIKKTTENYTVEWSEGVNPDSDINDGETLRYRAQKVIDCKKGSSVSTSAAVFCSFKNKCNQTKTQNMMVEVIFVGDQYCREEGDWKITKAGFNAEIKCSQLAGLRKRKCSKQNNENDDLGKWEDEVSGCIEQKLYTVLERAEISDIGLGILEKNAADVLHDFKKITRESTLPGYANLAASVKVISTVENKLSETNMTNETAIIDFIDSSSYLLNLSLAGSWNTTPPENTSSSIAEDYLLSVEKFIGRSTIAAIKKTEKENLAVDVCNDNETCTRPIFNVTISHSNAGVVRTIRFKNLQNYLPCKNNSVPNSIVVSATAEKQKGIKITIDFDLIKQRPRNIKLECVFWDTNLTQWSTEGCKWEGPSKEGRCVCEHLSSFAILMSKEPLEVPGLTYVTYVAVSISVLSLIINLVIEFIVWSDVVKTSTSYLRHTAHVNISLCLLIADLCFLASLQPKGISDLWCRTSVVLKHFCFLAMFFWMFCLSATLLHQAVFLFHKVSKKNYLRFSILIGYVCPLLIVFVTFLTNNGGAEGMYYSKDSCWLVYSGLFKGSIYTFIIPVGVIVFINIFSMFVVIMKLITHHAEINKKTDISAEDEKAAAKTVVRTVILLTPIFGVTWIFGFAVLALDLTSGPGAYTVNYIFTLLNGFQGLFILLTTCFGDKMTREALRRYLKKSPESSISESSTKQESTGKK